MNNKIPTFSKFSENRNQKIEEQSKLNEYSKLKRITEDYHDSQLKLQELQKKLIDFPKENKVEREELKKAIIEQIAIVKKKESKFNKAIGDEDLKDLEI